MAISLVLSEVFSVDRYHHLHPEAEPKISAPRQTPSRGRRTAKI